MDLSSEDYERARRMEGEFRPCTRAADEFATLANNIEDASPSVATDLLWQNREKILRALRMYANVLDEVV